MPNIIAIEGRRALRRLAMVLVTVLVFAMPYAVVPAKAAESGKIEQTSDVLNAVVKVRAKLSPNDPSSGSLGTEREGSGVLIDDNGLILTINYLMRRAESAEITDSSGNVVPAVVIGHDDETGFGLLRALSPVKAQPLALGSSDALAAGERVLVVSLNTSHDVTPARVFVRRSFAAPWEYILDNAIFTAPAHENFGGAALLGQDGRLVGIGHLFVNVGEPLAMIPGNMFVPIDLLKPILEEMVANGHRKGLSRPWLGIRPDDSRGQVIVTRVVSNSPGEAAGIKPGDVLVGVDGKRVRTMLDFFRNVWALGPAGTTIPLNVFRAEDKGMEIQRIEVKSIDRKDRYRVGGQQGL